MTMLEVVAHLFRLDVGPAKGLFFDNLLWILFLLFLIAFVFPKAWRWPGVGLLALGIMLGSLDVSFFVGLFQWNAFAIGGILCGVAWLGTGKQWPIASWWLMVLLTAFGSFLALSGWHFTNQLLLWTVSYIVLIFLAGQTRFVKAINPYLINGSLLLLSWYFSLHWA